MNSDNDNNIKFSLSGASSLLGVSVDFLYKEVREKRLSFCKESPVPMLTLAEIKKYREDMKESRSKVLDELTAEGQKLGIGY